MIAIIGCGQSLELVTLCFPVEVARVDHYATNLRGMTVHILCGGMGYDVASPFDRPTVDGRGKGIVDDERHAVLVGDVSEAFDVEH